VSPAGRRSTPLEVGSSPAAAHTRRRAGQATCLFALDALPADAQYGGPERRDETVRSLHARAVCNELVSSTGKRLSAALTCRARSSSSASCPWPCPSLPLAASASWPPSSLLDSVPVATGLDTSWQPLPLMGTRIHMRTFGRKLAVPPVLSSGSRKLANGGAVDSQPDRAGSRVDRLDCAEGGSPPVLPKQPPLRDHYLVGMLHMLLVANVVDEADVAAVARANGISRARRKPTAQLSILWRVSAATPHAFRDFARLLRGAWRCARRGSSRVLACAVFWTRPAPTPRAGSACISVRRPDPCSARNKLPAQRRLPYERP
jgi:hypothetical protein